MNNELYPQGYKAGYAALVGRPNVGKSTLVNTFMEQMIAPVTPKPQTTQRKQLGILTLEDAQIILVDTPGMHHPTHELGRFMIEAIKSSLEDADVIVWIVDGSEKPHSDDLLLLESLKKIPIEIPIILAVNKVDKTSSRQLLEENIKRFQEMLPDADVFHLSAKTGFGCQELLTGIIQKLPPGQPFYDSQQITDQFEREIAAELIRSAALVHLRDEVPYSIGIHIDEYNERGDIGAHIVATLYVERESHKGIVIGKGAATLKAIGTTARKEIELMSGRKVFLELKVKVNKNWRNKQDALKMMGYLKED